MERLASVDQLAAKLQQPDLDKLEEADLKTPVALLLAFANNENVNHSLRVSAAASAAPYLHPRYGSREVPRVIDTPFDFPEPRSIQQAVATIAKVSALAACGKIALKDATELVSINKTFVDALTASELEQRVTNLENSRNQDNAPVHVIGGLPRLPGTSILGLPPHTQPDTVIEHQPPVIVHEKAEAS